MQGLRPIWSRGWLIFISGLFFFLSLLKVSSSGATATTRGRPPLYTRVKDKRTIGSSIIMTRPPRHTGGQRDTRWVRVFTPSGATCIEGMYYMHKSLEGHFLFGLADEVSVDVWTKTCSVSCHHSPLQGNWLRSRTPRRGSWKHSHTDNLMLEITKY